MPLEKAPDRQKTDAPPRVAMVAGEASGDMYGALIADELARAFPGVVLSGIGGPAMERAGQSQLFTSRDLGVMGLFEVLPKLAFIRRSLREMKRLLAETRPHLLILIDFQDYNLRLAKIARGLGVRVLFFIGPKAWVWRKGRAFKLARVIDHLAVILPFETEFWAGIDPKLPVTYVGHPLVDHVASQPDNREFTLPPGAKAVGLLPGSRLGEIARCLPVMMGAARLMLEKDPDIRFLLPRAPGLDQEKLEPHFGGDCPWLTVVEGRSLDVMRRADLLLVTSGTATLEAALVGTPMVVVYKTGALSRFVGLRIIKSKVFSLPNLIAGRAIVPELILEPPTAQTLAGAALNLWANREARQRMLNDLATVREMVGGPGACRRTAAIAVEMIKENRRA